MLCQVYDIRMLERILSVHGDMYGIMHNYHVHMLQAVSTSLLQTVATKAIWWR